MSVFLSVMCLGHLTLMEQAKYVIQTILCILRNIWLHVARVICYANKAIITISCLIHINVPQELPKPVDRLTMCETRA